MRVSIVQLNTKSNKQENLDKVKRFVLQAVEEGAELISLPEYFNYLGEDEVRNAEDISNGETVSFLSELAKDNGVFIHVGSMLEKYDELKSKNTSLMINPEGEVIGTYEKIHLFDIDIPNGESHCESDTVVGGEKPQIVDLPFGQAGLSICYDIRFPELFRYYTVNQCSVLFIPAAFTLYTGMLHWEPLLRARAIENQCYVIAAGQVGSYAEGMYTHGNSMIIDPWGTVIARASETECVITATLDKKLVRDARDSIPCLTHRKPEYYKY